jgi:hypothetical protein
MGIEEEKTPAQKAGVKTEFMKEGRNNWLDLIRKQLLLDIFNPDQIIPFLLIDGQFMQAGSGYSPELLEGMDHAKVKAELENPASPVGKAIRTEADNITALICKSIGNKADACNLENVTSLTETI